MLMDINQVDQKLATSFIRRARLADKHRYPIGSTSEQIVAALLNGRADWLPEPYTNPLEAIRRLYAGGPEWWHTMLYVSQMDWQEL